MVSSEPVVSLPRVSPAVTKHRLCSTELFWSFSSFSDSSIASFRQSAGSKASVNLVSENWSAYFSQRVDDIERLKCKTRQISSSYERYIILLGFFVHSHWTIIELNTSRVNQVTCKTPGLSFLFEEGDRRTLDWSIKPRTDPSKLLYYRHPTSPSFALGTAKHERWINEISTVILRFDGSVYV